MQAELIFTGSELLLGHVLNTHAQYIGRKLSEIGVEIILHTTVGDDWERMAIILRQALTRSELVITTGGLGPTTDDLTKETVAGVLGLPMVLDENSLARIKAHFAERGVAMPESIAKQAYLPEGSHVLPNPRGTAPGILIEKDRKTILMLPGPPSELVEIFESSLAPYLAAWAGQGVVTRHRIYKLTGVAESAVQDQLKDLGVQSNPAIAYLVMPGEVQVRMTAKAGNAEKAEKMVSDLAEKVRRRLGGYIF
ncbi:MAG: competence/damage-inducible protein A, partial [Peptococcaceae bacterium]